jgi:hypothetical protein
MLTLKKGGMLILFVFNLIITEAPITMVAQSKMWTVFALWDTGVVGSNPTGGMDVCVTLFCV